MTSRIKGIIPTSTRITWGEWLDTRLALTVHWTVLRDAKTQRQAVVGKGERRRKSKDQAWAHPSIDHPVPVAGGTSGHTFNGGHSIFQFPYGPATHLMFAVVPGGFSLDCLSSFGGTPDPVPVKA